MKKIWRTGAFWFAVIFAFELVFHLFLTKSLSWRFLCSLPFTLSLAVFLTGISHLWKKPLLNRVTRIVLLAVLILIFGVQTVYYRIFGGMLSLAYVGMGGEAIAAFLGVTLRAMLAVSPILVFYLVSVPALIYLEKRGVLSLEGAGWRENVLLLGASVLVFSVGVPEEDAQTARSAAYYDNTGHVERQTEYFGLFTAERMDLKRLAGGGTGLSTDVIDITGGSAGGTGEPDPAEGPDSSDTTENGDGNEPSAVEPATKPELNIMEDMDFSVLAEKAPDEETRDLSLYFSKLTGTEKNEYTGLFRGFNVIEICAESFVPRFIDPELTPALYRLSNEGFVFKNFYCSFPNTTTNGEYSMCMGLLPDFSRQSFATSMDNYVPFTLGNQFKGMGLTPLSYHGNIATFYGRINTHTNMGYDFKALDFGLELERTFPTSDLELFQKTMDEYIDDDRFIVHYMSYSGHHPYNVEDNDIAAKNWDRVKDLDYPDAVRSYIACQLELEYGLEYMLDRLEKAGKADTTLIVLTGDHLPYALTEEEYAAMAGTDVRTDPFWRYKNAFICWSGAMEEPVVVDEYCCTQDILPTISNLLGIEYDSRLMTGTDILSTATHVAVLDDGSFRTRDILYNSDAGSTTYFTRRENLPENYARDLIAVVKNQYSVAAAILRTNYYEYAFSTLGIADTILHTDSEASFYDFTGEWYEQDVERLVRLGVINGTRGAFGGGDAVSIAEVTAMVSRLLYLPDPETEPEGFFPDVGDINWFYNDVRKAWAAGILPPTGDGLLHADDMITIDYFKAVYANAAAYIGISDPEAWAEETFNDVMDTARENGSETGYLIRGTAAALVARLIMSSYG